MEYVYTQIDGKSVKEAIKYIESFLDDVYTIKYDQKEFQSSYKKTRVQKPTATIKNSTITVKGFATEWAFCSVIFDAITENPSEELIESLKKSYRLIDGQKKMVTVPPKRFLLNTQNSCALDSLLSIIFYAYGGYFMRMIAMSDIEEATYPRWINPEGMKIVSTLVQSRLKSLYHSEKFTNASEVQKYLAKYTKEKCNDYKAVYELWNVLCMMFNRLPVKVRTLRERLIGNDPVEVYSFAEKIGVLEYWPNHLVYVNDADISKRDWTEYNVTGFELVGVVNYHSEHYTSTVKINGDWYNYNDLDGKFKSVSGDEVLVQTKNKKICMMFYVRNL